MCSSMVLKAVRSSSTSGPPPRLSARNGSRAAVSDRSCEAMPCAVCAMSLSGFRPRRSTLRPTTTSASRASPNAITWTVISRRTVSSISPVGAPLTRITPGVTSQLRSRYSPTPGMSSVRSTSVCAEICALATAVRPVTSSGRSPGSSGLRSTGEPCDTSYTA